MHRVLYGDEFDMEQATFEHLGISLLLGLLVGLQREHAASPLAGLRTFPLITVLGTLSALVDRSFEAGGWIVAASLLGVVVLIAMGKVHEMLSTQTDIGMTTEFAMLLMHVVGIYLVLGERLVAVAVGGGVAVLLEFKPQLHGFVARLNDSDVRAIMQFVLITCVVLPVLPNQTYGPFEVFNPFEAWLMVVLIVGISLGGYALYKLTGNRAGAVLGGLLGGVVSSTATTVSNARRTADQAELARLSALVILIASTVVYVRLMIEIAAVEPRFLAVAIGPLACLLAVGAAVSTVLWVANSKAQTEMPKLKNPTELGSALVFGAVYVLVLLALAAAKHWLGGSGLYAVAALSGLTDVDAITLSTSRLVKQQEAGIPAMLGWRLIVLATMSNLVFKLGMVAALGTRRLLWLTLLAFAGPLVTGALLICFWPDTWQVPVHTWWESLPH